MTNFCVNLFVTLKILSYLDFNDLCIAEQLTWDIRKHIFSTGNGELWRLLFVKYFPTLELQPEPGGTWKGLFQQHYTWQVCVHTGETFERTRNSSHAVKIQCANGKEEGWHVSTLCPEELNPNLQPHPVDFIVDVIRGPRRCDFLFHFPAQCCPLVRSYDNMVHSLQMAYNDSVAQAQESGLPFQVVAKREYPQYVGLLVEMQSEGCTSAVRHFAAMETARVKRLMANKSF
uniref:F-box domain-containing protein n=1 Tax=Eutreptiella gymnastica TaxID=73025 RepID=A0A7S4LPT5_9EUGL